MLLKPAGIRCCGVSLNVSEPPRPPRRLDPVIRGLKSERSPGWEAGVKAREKALLPVYSQVARQFADMHDTPVRMVAKGVLQVGG